MGRKKEILVAAGQTALGALTNAAAVVNVYTLATIPKTPDWFWANIGVGIATVGNTYMTGLLYNRARKNFAGKGNASKLDYLKSDENKVSF